MELSYRAKLQSHLINKAEEACKLLLEKEPESDLYFKYYVYKNDKCLDIQSSISTLGPSFGCDMPVELIEHNVPVIVDGKVICRMLDEEAWEKAKARWKQKCTNDIAEIKILLADLFPASNYKECFNYVMQARKLGSLDIIHNIRDLINDLNLLYSTGLLREDL